MKKKIIVEIKGGCVWLVTGIPDDVIVEVRDYDAVQGMADYECKHDADGDAYTSEVYNEE